MLPRSSYSLTLYSNYSIEFSPCGDLRQYVESNCPNGLERAKAVSYVAQTFCALEYMHDLAICHRDIKPANTVRFDDDSVKVCDFDYATVWKTEGRINWRGGTRNLQSPEIWTARQDEEGMNYHNLDGSKVDIYATGVTFHWLLVGTDGFPYKLAPANTSLATRRDAKLASNSPPTVIERDPESKNVIEKLLNATPENRPSASECLEYPQFRQDGLKRAKKLVLPKGSVSLDSQAMAHLSSKDCSKRLKPPGCEIGNEGDTEE